MGHSTLTGTATRYQAPELADPAATGHGPAADMWSFGVIGCECPSRRTALWHWLSTLMQALRQGLHSQACLCSSHSLRWNAGRILLPQCTLDGLHCLYCVHGMLNGVRHAAACDRAHVPAGIPAAYGSDQLLCADLPFGRRDPRSPAALAQRIVRGQYAPMTADRVRPEYHSLCGGALTSLVERCLQVDPERRPSAAEALEGPLFKFRR